jgi:hypothetical protein
MKPGAPFPRPTDMYLVDTKNSREKMTGIIPIKLDNTCEGKINTKIKEKSQKT